MKSQHRCRDIEITRRTAVVDAHTYGIEYRSGTMPSAVFRSGGARTRWIVLRMVSFDPVMGMSALMVNSDTGCDYIASKNRLHWQRQIATTVELAKLTGHEFFKGYLCVKSLTMKLPGFVGFSTSRPPTSSWNRSWWTWPWTLGSNTTTRTIRWWTQSRNGRLFSEFDCFLEYGGVRWNSGFQHRCHCVTKK